MSYKVYDLHKRFLKHEEIKDEDLKNLSPQEIRQLCTVFVRDYDTALLNIRILEAK